MYVWERNSDCGFEKMAGEYNGEGLQNRAPPAAERAGSHFLNTLSLAPCGHPHRHECEMALKPVTPNTEMKVVPHQSLRTKGTGEERAATALQRHVSKWDSPVLLNMHQQETRPRLY